MTDTIRYISQCQWLSLHSNCLGIGELLLTTITVCWCEWIIGRRVFVKLWNIGHWYWITKYKCSSANNYNSTSIVGSRDIRESTACIWHSANCLVSLELIITSPVRLIHVEPFSLQCIVLGKLNWCTRVLFVIPTRKGKRSSKCWNIVVSFIKRETRIRMQLFLKMHYILSHLQNRSPNSIEIKRLFGYFLWRLSKTFWSKDMWAWLYILSFLI